MESSVGRGSVSGNWEALSHGSEDGLFIEEPVDELFGRGGSEPDVILASNDSREHRVTEILNSDAVVVAWPC